MSDNEKLWRDITYSSTLKELLTSLTKDQLTTIRKHLGVPGVSHLNKGELVQVLQIQLVDCLVDTLSYLDTDQCKVLTGLLKKTTSGPFEISLEQLNFFTSRGLLFSGIDKGKKVVVLPREYANKLSALDKDINLQRTIKRNTQWTRITRGLLYFYGALTISDLIEMVNKYTNDLSPKAMSEYLMVLNNAKDFYIEITRPPEGYAYYRVPDALQILYQHKIRAEVEYYPFTYEQISKAGDRGFIDRNLAFNRFTKFLMESYEIPRGEAEEFVEDFTDAIKQDTPLTDIVEGLQDNFEIISMEVLQLFIDELTFLHNNTRLWVLKGHTPSELSPYKEKSKPPTSPKLRLVVDNGKEPKIGRNELCPCGSGRKYKRCCGK